MSKLSVLKFSRDIGKQFSQLAFVISCLLITKRKESCCNKLKKFGLVKTEILYKLKGVV